MSTLNPTQDSRTSYDEATGAVRSFFGAELVEPLPEAKRGLTMTEKVDDFLEVNRHLFKLENIILEKSESKEGAASQSVSYVQQHNGIPVYHAHLVVGQRKVDGIVTSAMNSVDYNLPETLSPDQVTVTAENVLEILHQRFDSQFAKVTFAPPTLFVYRHKIVPEDEPQRINRPIRQTMLALATGESGRAYIVWQVFVDTQDPSGEWELLIDATNGAIVAVKDRRLSVTRKGFVFWPDPVRSRQDETLNWATDENTLNQERVEVDLQNLDAPVNNKYKLNGTWVESVDWQSPTFNPPETTGDFKYGVKHDEFLNVMAYYYLDRLITDLRGLGCTQFNNATSKVKVDAQGYDIDNSSSSQDSSGHLVILLGKGGVPDASDPAVVVHEYGHSIYRLMGVASTYPYSCEQGWCDFLAACWLDRFNEHQFQREEVFPWDNCSSVHWDATRRLDCKERFDDANFSSYGHDFKGSIYATALWDCFLNIGGNSSNANIRRWAADEIIRTYLDMLVFLDSNEAQQEDYKKLVQALITADFNRTGGLYKKVIWDAFRRRGAWQDFTPIGNIDPYIRDISGDTGEHASPEVHWASPDIWVRNNPPPANPNDPNDPNYGENPDAGHQPPINDVPNYMYVRIHNRGSQDVPANTFSVEGFHCSPATAMLYPDHFQSIAKLTIAEPIPANGGSVRVGPFPWTPQIKYHECLFAIVDGTSDPAIAKQLKGSVDHWKLVRYDNNVGQVNVAPQSSVPGGKTKTSFLVRGTVYSSLNQLTVDATALPADTHIEVHLARRLTDQATGLSGFILSSQNTRWSTLTLPGGQVGAINDFPLEAHDQKSVTLMVDFSYQAEHLHRYPIIVTQTQEGQISGRLTIEITAVKETEDFVYGNPNSMELHTINCPLWSRIAQHHKIPFMTVKDGIVRGYNGCAFCLPDYNTG